jgi:hypothetical protein
VFTHCLQGVISEVECSKAYREVIDGGQERNVTVVYGSGGWTRSPTSGPPVKERGEVGALLPS